MDILDAMSANILNFKQVDQLGIVVSDMNVAVRKFTGKLGVKSWYRSAGMAGNKSNINYRGKEIVSELDIVMGFCGNLQIELVATGGDRNIYNEHLEKHGEGLHHICFFVSDINKKLAAYSKLGMEPIQSGMVKGKGGDVTQYAYLDPTESNGVIIELVETKIHGISTRMSPLMMFIGHMIGDLVKVG
jgi:methylmalonyl-CoA/ethylmalonyl-CoA epimerase